MAVVAVAQGQHACCDVVGIQLVNLGGVSGAWRAGIDKSPQLEMHETTRSLVTQSPSEGGGQ
eukprot:9479142-Pyramimonas_sp.AAC.1